MKNNIWKVALIVIVGIIAVIMMGVFMVQGAQNQAFTLEEQVNTALSDIKVQEKRRVDLVYNLVDCVTLYDALESIGEIPAKVISSDITEKNGTAWVIARSATFMRGINLQRKVLIVDECQNMTVPIIKRILTRPHDNCKVIVCGCLAQMDIPVRDSGFKQLIEHMEDYEGSIKCELPISYRGRLAMHIDKL